MMAKMIIHKRKSYAIIEDSDGNLMIPIRLYNTSKLAYRMLERIERRSK